MVKRVAPFQMVEEEEMKLWETSERVVKPEASAGEAVSMWSNRQVSKWSNRKPRLARQLPLSSPPSTTNTTSTGSSWRYIYIYGVVK